MAKEHITIMLMNLQMGKLKNKITIWFQLTIWKTLLESRL